MQGGERRRLHNLVQELRGNIRVYVRVKPLTPDEKAAGMSPVLKCSSDASRIECNAGTSTKAFDFDRVFHERSTQAEVFSEVAGLVTSALDGCADQSSESLQQLCIRITWSDCGRTFKAQQKSQPYNTSATLHNVHGALMAAFKSSVCTSMQNLAMRLDVHHCSSRLPPANSVYSEPMSVQVQRVRVCVWPDRQRQDAHHGRPS